MQIIDLFGAWLRLSSGFIDLASQRGKLDYEVELMVLCADGISRILVSDAFFNATGLLDPFLKVIDQLVQKLLAQLFTMA